MTRWVVRHPRMDEAPSQDLERAASDPEIEMIAKADRGLALLEVPDEALPRLQKLLPGWQIDREQEGRLP